MPCILQVCLVLDQRERFGDHIRSTLGSSRTDKHAEAVRQLSALGVNVIVSLPNQYCPETCRGLLEFSLPSKHSSCTESRDLGYHANRRRLCKTHLRVDLDHLGHPAPIALLSPGCGIETCFTKEKQQSSWKPKAILPINTCNGRPDWRLY